MLRVVCRHAYAAMHTNHIQYKGYTMRTLTFQEALAKCLLNSDLTMRRVKGYIEYTVAISGNLYLRDEYTEGIWERCTDFPLSHGEWVIDKK